MWNENSIDIATFSAFVIVGLVYVVILLSLLFFNKYLIKAYGTTSLFAKKRTNRVVLTLLLFYAVPLILFITCCLMNYQKMATLIFFAIIASIPFFAKYIGRKYSIASSEEYNITNHNHED